MENRSEILTPLAALPESYTRIWDLDLSRDRKTALLLNLLSLPLFVLFGWIFLSVASVFRPEISSLDFLRKLTAHMATLYVEFLLVVIVFTVLHECIHGIFFWLFTRDRPVFGVRLLYAYAGAPQWYIPRNQYAIIGLAPFVCISVVGMAVLPLVSLSAAQIILFGMVMNAAGAIGDLYVSGVVMRLPPDVMIQDTGFIFTVFGNVNPH